MMKAEIKTFIISAPSGAGKTTLNRMLVERHPNVEISISLTTRSKRANEKDGHHYYFVSKDFFEKQVIDEKVLEWAEVHNNLYGTTLAEITRIQDAEHIPILEIDVQGWQQAKAKLNSCVSIFILPPSLKDLWFRLEHRGTDSAAVRWRRLLNAKSEIEKAINYDFFIVNDDLNTAFNELEKIIIKGELGSINTDEGRQLCKKLLEEFNTSEWFKELRKELELKREIDGI